MCLSGTVSAQTAEKVSGKQRSSGRDAAQADQNSNLVYERWSGSINVPDPVAISVDPQGRVFVTQTRRRKIQDLDIRQNRDWIPDDVSFESVADKRDFYHQRLAVGGDQIKQAKHVGDVNEDGQHDWRDLTVVSEQIYRLVDSDGDGTADQITPFAADFRTEVTGIAAGVMAFGGDVYATVAPDVWRLTDSDDDGIADDRSVVATGFGLHIAYAGHDMHGLTVGPDGKIYWSIGDKGISAQNDKGELFSYPNQGGVMRCNPDGSDFEVFAHGLRNVQEFAFDQYGNIFGVDNDADMPGERERFVAIVDGMDAGWRCNYQYRGSDYNPWTDEKLWQLPGDDHPAYIVPPISHYVDGPAGFKFNPGTALSRRYIDHFFMTSAPNGSQYAFQVEPNGDSFMMTGEHKIGSGPAIVGLAFGPDGGLYGADWDGGYPLDEKGAVIRIDAPEFERHNLREQVAGILTAGFSDVPTETLAGWLNHSDQRVRQGSQFELVKRDERDSLAGTLTDPKNGVLARLHAVWGLGQLARAGDSSATLAIATVLSDDDPHVRGQASKTLGEITTADSSPIVPLLSDSSLHVRVLAGLAIARNVPPSKDAAGLQLIRHAGELQSDQHYLRHSIVSALAACADPQSLAALADHQTQAVRLCAVLALRRQGSQHVSAFLNDKSLLVTTAAARAIHDDRSIPAALPLLAQSLGHHDHEAFARRAINANFRIGSPDCFSAVLAYALATDPQNLLRIEAIESLASWMEPSVLDRVEGRFRRLPVETRSFDRTAAAAGFAELSRDTNPRVQTAAITAARKLKITLSRESLEAFVRQTKLAPSLRAEALDSIADFLDESAESLCTEMLTQKSPTLALKALQLLGQHFPESAADRIPNVFTKNPSIAIRQACIRIAGQLGQPDSDRWLLEVAAEAAAEKLPSSLMLDISESVRVRRDASPELSDSANAILQLALARVRGDEKLVKFAFTRDGGDADVGQAIFNTNVSAQCVRCHRVEKKGSEIGPALTKIAKQRDADYLWRAVVTPSADIDAKYRSVAFLLASGEVVKGVIQSETKDEIVLADSSGNLVKVPIDEIEDESEQKVSLMPNLHDVLNPWQMRDVIAYLRTLK